MKVLYQTFEERLRKTTLDFKRYLYPSINWKNRLFGIVGPRGVGKTTLLLQHIRENHSTADTLYVSMDDLYFASHSLIETADTFHKNGGKFLFIDEVHKYPEWSRTLKNLYDNYPNLNVVFSGSSILDILKGNADLSRRALLFHLQGLSFREYLLLFHNITIPVFCLSEKEPDSGNLRETVFFNQMRVNNSVYRSAKADFNIDNITFEVGGKSKNQKQIEGLKNAYIVKDDIEYAYQNVIPLWAFGLNY